MCTIFVVISSGGRHTRYWRDWSSDVCSSDLAPSPSPVLSPPSPCSDARAGAMARAWTLLVVTILCAGCATAYSEGQYALQKRSEERRVGKESRSRWSPYHYKNKSKTSPGSSE